MSTRALTPPTLAQRWGVDPAKVLAFIRSGSLRAFDVSSPGSRRPRYRISIDAVIEFEQHRSATTPAKPVKRRRRKKDESFVEYF